MLAVFRLVAVSYVCNILYLVCSCNCDVQVKGTKKTPPHKKTQKKTKTKQQTKKKPKNPSTNTTKQSPLLQELVKTEANNAMI